MSSSRSSVTPSRPPHVERDRDHDAAQPAGERRRLLQVAEPAKRPQIRLLGRILRRRRVAQHAQRDGIRHRLRGLHQPAVGLDVARLGANDEIAQGLHRLLVRC